MSVAENHPIFSVKVDEAGCLLLPADIAARYGLLPGATIYLDVEANSLRLRRSTAQLSRLYIEPTNFCNLNCTMCIRNAWQEVAGWMSKDVFSQVVEGVRHLPSPPSVCFSGFGEPLSHPAITEMISLIKPFCQQVELITNGTMLNEENSRQLLEAGLDVLWVSLDGATPESFSDIRLGAELPRILHNITNFHKIRNRLGFREVLIGIAFVAMKRNVADLPRLLRMSSQLGVSRFLVTNVLPYTPEMCTETLYNRSLNDIAYFPTNWAPTVELPRMDTNEITREALYQMLRGGNAVTNHGDLPGRGSNRCPFIERGSAVIAWDGSLSPCLALLHNHISYLNRRERISTCHSFGNLQQQSLYDLWNSPAYADFRARVQAFDFSPCTVCGGCDMSLENQEDCFGNTFPTCGGCLWAQGVIQCP